MSDKNTDQAPEETAENVNAQEAAEQAEGTIEFETPKEKTPEETIAELERKVLLARADFDNFRKRTQRDLTDARAFAKMSCVEELLPVMDTFKMAMQATEMDNASLETLVMGMNMIQNQIDSVFSGLGVKEINAAGEKFDHHQHEAVASEFSDEVEVDVIISQHRCGYIFGERLIRPATVVVSKGPEVEETESNEASEEES